MFFLFDAHDDRVRRAHNTHRFSAGFGAERVTYENAAAGPIYIGVTATGAGSSEYTVLASTACNATAAGATAGGGGGTSAAADALADVYPQLQE